MKQLLSIFTFLILSQAAIAQNTILWKITDTIHDKTSYMIGTFHQFGNSFVDSIPEIEAALSQSELAIFESIDKVAATRKRINQRQASLEIEKRLKKKDFRKLKEIARTWKVDIYKLKPVEIYWKLQQEYQKLVCGTSKATDTFDEFDGYLRHLAAKHAIETKGLETNQLAIIEKASNNPDWKKERKNISLWIKKITKDDATHADCTFAKRYRAFDLLYEFAAPCQHEVLVKERNANWMKTLPDLLRTKNAFVAVGYFHLRWQCGLLEQLKEEGFKVEPVTISPVIDKS